MEYSELEPVIEGILFASGEAVSVQRLSAVLARPEEDIVEAAESLAGRLLYDKRGIRLVKLDGALQLCSAPEYGDIIRIALESRKPPKLTQTALEVLAITAYFQPVTRAYIDQLRGTDSSYTVGVLTERGLIEPCGTLDAPGRPTLFRTTGSFLRVFGISSLDELPELPPSDGEDPEQLRIEGAIENLRSADGESGKDTDAETAQ